MFYQSNNLEKMKTLFLIIPEIKIFIFFQNENNNERSERERKSEMSGNAYHHSIE